VSAAARFARRAALRGEGFPGGISHKRSMSAYGAFLKASAKDKALKKELIGLSIGQRGKALGKKWRALDAKTKSKYTKSASKIKVSVRVRRPFTRKTNSFNTFLVKNFNKVRALPFNRRMKAVAALYKKWKK